MTGLPLILTFILAICLMIVSISRWKIHPFISIMIVSLILAFAAGIPMVDRTLGDGQKVPGITTVIGQGFSGTFTSIGIVIILGALIGSILEKTGAALRLADGVIRLVGKKNPALALELMGWIVSIPVFCDSGFVILNPIRKALVRRTGASSVSLTFALMTGLYLSHVFIPPTPGPIAAANTLGIGENLLLVMGMGLLCSVFPLAAGLGYAKFIGGRVKADDEIQDAELGKTYEQIVSSYDSMPSLLWACMPIAVPIILMAIASVISMAGLKGGLSEAMSFLGTPVMALSAGALLAFVLLRISGKAAEGYSITNETLKTVGPILFVTAAGGVLGKVIAASDMVNYITSHADQISRIGIFFPFILSAVLKSAQGSSTVALTTTAGILAPLLAPLGFTTAAQTSLAVMAIGAGAMTVSHANDSFFWVVTNFGALTPERGYKVQTLGTLVLGLSAMLEIWILSLCL